MDSYKTVSGEASAEIVIDRSRFIALIKPVSSEEEAVEVINATRSKYHDARHNCYAFRLADSTARFSDDGEPHSTAGKPMMDVIVGAGLFDVVVVVTRYFGGILLGTGGLVRAYSSATAEAISNADVVTMTECDTYTVKCPYQYFEVLKLFLEENGCKVLNPEFTDSVLVTYVTPSINSEKIATDLIEKFSGRLGAQFLKREFAAF